jgi:hypothetical protein
MRHVLCAALIALAIPAPAQDTTVEKGGLVLSTGATRFVTPGLKDAKELEAQLAVRLSTPAKTITEAFARWTRTQGASEDTAGLYNPRTFASLNADISIARTVTTYLDVLCAVGVSWNRDGDFNPSDPRLYNAGCGLRGRIKQGSLSFIPGHQGTVGGWGVGGKLVVNQSPSVRYVATYTLPFQRPELFRTNPGQLTGGVQLDVKRLSF